MYCNKIFITLITLNKNVPETEIRLILKINKFFKAQMIQGLVEKKKKKVLLNK